VLTLLTYTLYALCGVLTVWAGVQAIRDKPANMALIVFTGVLLLGLLVQLVLGIVLWPQAGGTDALLFFGYVLTAIVLVPLAGGWAFIELTRWGPLVLALTGLTVIVMIVRMDQIWL
jgi:hypothetical protein